jgi:microsomal dipeptidase-like Zn-dependent dipeptidase
VAHSISELDAINGGDGVAAIGTDFDGFTTPPTDLDNLGEMSRLTERLVLDGLNDDQVRGVLGENALRALRRGWGKERCSVVA